MTTEFDGEWGQAEQAAAQEEGYYFHILEEFIAVVEHYGFEKVYKDVEAIVARHRGLQAS